MIRTIAVVFALCCADAQAASTADKAAIAAANAVVASADVCKDDEWSYLCNKDAWAGAADAVTGGKELQTAALRRALDHTVAHTSCVAGDAACAAAKEIVDAQLLDIPKVVNSNRLAQVHDGAGLIHPATKTLSWTTATNQVGAGAALMHTTAVYTGDTKVIDTVVGAGTGSNFIDDVSLTKWVNAAVKNGCDDNDGEANDAAQRLAGDKDVRGSAHVLVNSAHTSCSSAGTVAEKEKCKSLLGQGRKACQAAGCTYTTPDLVSVAFSYADLTATGVAAAAVDPTTTKWRLCMTSPSVAHNTIFADTGLTVSAVCRTNEQWMNRHCACKAGYTADLMGTTIAGGNPTKLCQACPQGLTSVPTSANTHKCVACPAGKFGSGTLRGWDNAAMDSLAKRSAAAAGGCAGCSKGKYGLEHNTAAGGAQAPISVLDGGAWANGHSETHVCGACPKGTYNDVTGVATDQGCKGCGKTHYAKYGAATGQQSHAAVCVTECSTDGAVSANAAVYGLEGSDTFTNDDKNAGGAENDHGNLGVYGANDVQGSGGMRKCVHHGGCQSVKLFADPITKTCVGTGQCTAGLYEDGAPGAGSLCKQKKCAVNEHFVHAGGVRSSVCSPCPPGFSTGVLHASFHQGVGNSDAADNLDALSNTDKQSESPSVIAARNYKVVPTHCASSPCSAGKHVLNHVCTTCPTGKVSSKCTEKYVKVGATTTAGLVTASIAKLNAWKAAKTETNLLAFVALLGNCGTTGDNDSTCVAIQCGDDEYSYDSDAVAGVNQGCGKCGAGKTNNNGKAGGTHFTTGDTALTAPSVVKSGHATSKFWTHDGTINTNAEKVIEDGVCFHIECPANHQSSAGNGVCTKCATGKSLKGVDQGADSIDESDTAAGKCVGTKCAVGQGTDANGLCIWCADNLEQDAAEGGFPADKMWTSGVANKGCSKKKTCAANFEVLDATETAKLPEVADGAGAAAAATAWSAATTTKHAQQFACKACVAGKSRAGAANRDAAVACTTTVTCTVNQYISSRVCKDCAAGKWRAAGDTSLMADTTCDAMTCRTGHRVLNNECVKCVAGKVGTAGAAGDSTATNEVTSSCTPSDCGAATTGGCVGKLAAACTGKVANSVCVACDAGTTLASTTTGWPTWVQYLSLDDDLDALAINKGAIVQNPTDVTTATAYDNLATTSDSRVCANGAGLECGMTLKLTVTDVAGIGKMVTTVQIKTPGVGYKSNEVVVVAKALLAGATKDFKYMPYPKGRLGATDKACPNRICPTDQQHTAGADQKCLWCAVGTTATGKAKTGVTGNVKDYDNNGVTWKSGLGTATGTNPKLQVAGGCDKIVASPATLTLGQCPKGVVPAADTNGWVKTTTNAERGYYVKAITTTEVSKDDNAAAKANTVACALCPIGKHAAAFSLLFTAGNHQLENVAPAAGSEGGGACTAKVCPVHYYVPGTPSGETFDGSCKKCPAGKFNFVAGSTHVPTAKIAGHSHPCISKCLKNQYLKAGVNVCTNCPVGTVRNVEDNYCLASTAGVGCNTLSGVAPANFEAQVGGTDVTACAAIQCPLNSYVVGNRCTMCPAGKTAAAQMVAAVNANNCVATICTQDYHVQSNQCVKCATGYTKIKGDDASGADTMCHETVCKKDHKVVGNACVACNAWESHVPGTPTKGSNTDCTALKCAANFEVQNDAGHTCKACAQGKVRANEVSRSVAAACAATPCGKNHYVGVNFDLTCKACPVSLHNADKVAVPGAAEITVASFTTQPTNAKKTLTTAGTDDAMQLVTATEAGGVKTIKVYVSVVVNAAATKVHQIFLHSAVEAFAKGTTFTVAKAVLKTAAAAASDVDLKFVTGSAIAASTAASNGWACVGHYAHADTGHDFVLHRDTLSPLPLCTANQYVYNHKCVACPAGTANAAGDDPNTHVTTTCTAIPVAAAHTHAGDHICLKNEHVSNHMCVACSAGTANAAGDDRHHFDTACIAVVCNVHEHVVMTMEDVDRDAAKGFASGVSKDAAGKSYTFKCAHCNEHHKTNTVGDNASAGPTKCY